MELGKSVEHIGTVMNVSVRCPGVCGSPGDVTVTVMLCGDSTVLRRSLQFPGDLVELCSRFVSRISHNVPLSWLDTQR